jgi:hypothetical protein
MGKKLLITLGCSWTEGCGVYDEQALADYALHKRFGLLHTESRDRGSYARGSWPNQLAELMGWELLNLGKVSSSTSYQAKQLIMGDIDDKDYEQVLVIQQVSISSRFSFFAGKDDIRNFDPLEIQRTGEFARDIDHLERKFLEYYLVTANTIPGEHWETAFHLKCVESYCLARGWRFEYVTAWEGSFLDIPDNLNNYKSTACLHPAMAQAGYDGTLQEIVMNRLSHDGFALCKHPNKQGYEVIARAIYAGLGRPYWRD